MTVQYVVNGKTFDNEKEALEFEAECDRIREKREKLEREKESREKEIIDAYDHYEDLKNKYYEDYGRPQFNWNDFFRDFFEEEEE